MAIDPHDCRFMAVDAELLDDALDDGTAVHCLMAVWVCEHPRRQKASPGIQIPGLAEPMCVADVLGRCSLFEKMKCPKRERLTK